MALQKFDPEKVQCDLNFIRNNAMWNGVLGVVPFKIHFLTRFSSDHNKMSMANANIDELYAGSLTIKLTYVFFE